MVKYKSIVKVIKHSLTLKSVKEQISPYIKQITDNKEEYDFLMERVPKFYIRYYNHPIEHIEVFEKDGKVHQNDGDGTSVNHPPTMNHHTEYVLSMHNHPDKESEMQSNGDFSLQVEYNTKYGLSIGFHGIMITKNGYPFNPELSKEWGDIAYYNGDTAVMRIFRKMRKTNQECIDLQDAWANDEISTEEMDNRINELFGEELKSRDIDEIIGVQNDVFQNEGIPLNSIYVPVKKIYE